MEILYFLGRFHPLVLHLPIGFLLLAFGMEAWRRWRQGVSWQGAVHFALFAGMATAVLAAALGYCLSLEGGYEAGLLSRHQWLGIGTAALAVASWRWRHHDRWGFPLLSATVVVLLASGHYGGMLTHGRQYLWEHAPPVLARLASAETTPEAPIEDLASARVYAAFIQPIFNRKCVSCHNPDKAKGRLMMHEPAALLKGGEHGPPLVAGKPWESLLLQRIILPLALEEHMPPEGLPQIEPEELALLQWWIAAGADTAAQVAQIEVPAAIKPLLEARADDVWRLLARQVRPPAPRALRQARAAGIRLSPLSRESPLVEATLAYDTALSAAKLQRLTKISRQLVRLDLRHTPADDAMLSILDQLPHLVQLDLNNTRISDETLRRLQKARYLRSLNLYGTAITDSGLEELAVLPALRDLYLWQTQTTAEGIATLQQALPRLRVWSSREGDSLFQEVALKAPLIISEQTLFDDSLEVRLELNFGKLDIRYTLDGSEPDSSAQRYAGPLVLRQTSLLQARAYKAGWRPSDIAIQQFIKVRYRPRGIRLIRPPHERYAGEGSRSLHDFNQGSVRFSDGKWLGWEGQHLEAIIDLGESVAVSALSIGALEDYNAWIFFPRGLEVWASADGQHFAKAKTASFPPPAGPDVAQRRNFTAHFDPLTARYIRVKALSQMTNPPWHPNPGQPCWLFVDEILVE
jgi:uncharacterized membrane protein/mono/diheme cytochrome c family protein